MPAITPAEVAASLRRLADLIDNDPTFAAHAAASYLLQSYSGDTLRPDLNMPVNPDDARQIFSDVTASAEAAGIDVVAAGDDKYVGFRLLLGTFALYVYCPRDEYDPAVN